MISLDDMKELMLTRWIWAALASLMCVSAVVLCIRTSILRDQSLALDAPFSLARLQLMWWTLIVGICVLLNLAHNGTFPQVSGTCLSLFGMSIGTMTTAAIIDSRQRDVAAETTTTLHQDAASRRFLTDVLSDSGGLSVHRFQALVFNVIYGVSFLALYLHNDFEFPSFDPLTLTLFGVSSTGYLALKSLEQGTAPRNMANEP